MVRTSSDYLVDDSGGTAGPSAAPLSIVSVQAGRAKIVLAVMKSQSTIRVKIRQMNPDLTDVGGSLEEAKALRQEHDELVIKLNMKQREVGATLTQQAGGTSDNGATPEKILEQLSEAWKDVTKQLECRKMLLDQSVAFHTSALQLGKKMSQVEEKCKTTTIAHDVETARRLLQQHQELKKGVLEASMNTLQEGQLLLERIRKMAACADVSNRHATTSACYGIEQQLLRLQDRKRRLEELWYQRRQQLTLCIQLLLVDQKAVEIQKWIDTEADPLLANKDLGESAESSVRIQDEFLNKFNACLDKHDEVQRLLGRADYLVSTTLPQRAEVKSRLQTMLTRCDNIISGYIARRVNLIQAYKFFVMCDEANSKLEDVEVLAMRTDRTGEELAQRHAQLYQTIIDAAVHPIYLGQVLVRRLGRENPSVKTILTKVTELQDKCTKLESVCSAFHEHGKKNNEAVHQLECKYKKIYAWVTRVAQTRPEEELDVGKTQHTAQQYPIYNKEFSAECKDKQLDAKNLLSATENLAKSAAEKKAAGGENVEAATDAAAAADALLVKVKSLADALDELVTVSEKKSKLNRTLISYYLKTHQLYTLMDLVEELIRVEKDPSHITEATVKHKEEVCKSLGPLAQDVERITIQFNKEVDEAKLEDNLEPAVLAVQSMAPYYSQRTKLLNQFYEHWKVFVTAGRDFNVQWKQFVGEARKTMDWVLKVEHDFFPKLAGELGTSLSDVKAHEKRLEDFKPTIRRVQEEIEKQLKMAELISLKGDTRGQRDQMINELLKVHTRFQARIGEYRFLLNMATKFFENLAQLDKLIETTEKEYKAETMPKEVETCQKMLLEHELSKNKLRQYIDFSSEEADQIITRVRQQDSESDAREGVQKLLQMSEGKRKEWGNAWDDHKKRLEQNYLLSQFYFDLKKLQDELDELQHNLVSRHGNYGSSLSSVKMTSDAFRNFEKAADEIEGKVKEFTRTADRMIKDRHYDSRRVKHEVDDTEKKWNTFYNTIKSYRMALDDSAKFFGLMDGCEGWLNDAGQFLLGIGKRAPDCKTLEDVDTLIGEIEKYRLDGSKQQDDRLNTMERIATDLYGQVGGPEKMQNILDKNHEMFNAFVKAIEDLAVLRNNLMKTEQIIAGMGLGTDKSVGAGPKQFRFIQPLENAEIVEGLSFTFECRLESDKAPTIEWLKDGEPVKGFRASFKDGICRLDIDETMMKDCGKFVCKATTETGSIETSATLKVKVATQKTSTPEFSKHLRAADVPEGTSHTLECIVSGTPFPTVTWFHNDQPVQNNADYVMTIDNGRCLLKIRKMTKPLAGSYTCKISNPAGEVTTSATINAVAVRKPEFTEPLKDLCLKEGKPARLECKFNGEPPPQIQWMYNEEPLFPSAVFKITVEDTHTSLDIQQVYPEDCGSYTVIAKNLGGESRTSCLLSLDTAPPPSTARAPCKPEFIQPLQHLDAQEGRRARLECVCTGFPEPEIEWYHNDKLVKKGGKDFEISYDHGRCALLIQEVYIEDSGDYMCVAKNVHGSAHTKCRLIVEPLSEQGDGSAAAAGEVPPKFTQLLKDIEGIEGELVIFECRVIGHPTPAIKWYRGRNQIQSSNEFQIKSERELQTLTIPKAFKEDAGNYMVKATNDAGVAKCYATLVVKEADRHGMKMRLVESSHTMPGVVQEGHQPPTITRAFHDFTVKQGKPCSMEVIIVGRPQPKVQWLFNNEPVVTPDYKISAYGDTHILHIPSVMEEDAGRFSVVAENDSGKAWCSALLVVVDESQLIAGEGSPPETPQGGFFQPTYGPPPVVQKRPPRPTKADHSARTKTPEGPDSAPQFIQSLRDVSGDEGLRITLEAVVGGQPEPIIRWFKDGRALSGPVATEYEFNQLPGGRVSLVIPSARESDTGRYTCMANSSSGETSSSAEIRVKGVSAAPVFVERLQTSEVREGEPVRFRVRLSGKPTPQVKWYRGGQEIHSSPDFNITQHGDVHALYIPEVFYEDAGKFTVKAFSSAGETSCTAELIVEALSGAEDYATSASPFSRSPSLGVATAPAFTKPLFNRAAQVGQKITLECSIPPEPAPEKVQWYHNGVELHPSPAHQMSYSSGLCSLTLTRVQPDMRGRYVCSVTVNNQSGATDMHLDVMAPSAQEAPDRRPEFDDKLKNTEATEGKDATFFCRVQAQPPPKVQWMHDGRPIHPSGRHEVKLGRDGSCYLRIRDVQPSDTGVYTCVATNDLGQGSSAADLRVQPTGSSVDETSYVDAAGLRRVGGRARGLIDRGVGGVAEQYYRPVFQKIPADITVSEGQMARFDSVVSGRPIPDMLWFRDGTQVFSDILHKIVINEEGINSLIFDATTLIDAGLYTCIAQNRAGEDRFQVRLNVNRRPVTSVPRFISHMTNQNAYEGQSVTFTAQVEGIPPPTLSWQRDGRHIEVSDSHYRVHLEGNTSTLQIPQVGPEDNAWFECTASSIAGTATHRARLNVQLDHERAQSASRATPQYGAPSQRARTTTPVGARGYEGAGGPPGHFQSSTDISFTHQTPPPYGSSASARQSRSETTVRTVSASPSGSRPRDSSNGPQLIEPMKDIQVNEGGSVHFSCRIYSETEPTSEWFYNNSPLRPSPRHQISSREGGVYSLDMRGVTPSDSGVYKCTVSNEGGEVTCIAHLRVGSSTPSMRAEHHGRDRATPDYSGQDGGAGTRQQFGSSSGSRGPTPGLGQGHQTPRGWDHSSGEQRLEAESTRVQAELSQASRSQPAPPRFVTLLSDVSAAAGRPAHFEVTISGNPQPDVQWFKDGNLIQPSPDFKIQRSGDRYTLTISEAVPEDSGTITCRATNPSGTKEISAKLSVQGSGGAPKFLKPLQAVTAVDGSEVVMTCTVVGQPAPEVTWYHNGASLANSKDFIISYDPQSGRSQLIIADCMLDDQGTFKCLARNSSGQSETAATLTVVPDKKQQQQQGSGPLVKGGGPDGTMEITGYGDPPKFMQPIQPCVVVEGQACVFTAVVGGDPFPEITWLKEKQELVLTDRYRATVNRETGVCSLHINNCVMSDTGVYSCRASNAAGRATCTANVVIVPPNVEVTVTEKTMSVKKERVTMQGDQETRVIENSPTFTEALLPVIEVNEGEPIRLQCQVSAEPPPEIAWYFGGAHVTPGPRVNVSITSTYTTLNISSATMSDTGEYVCKANNSLGEAVTRTFLRVRKLDRDSSSTRVSSAQSAGSRTMTPQGHGGQYMSAGSAVEISMPPGSIGSGGPSGYRYADDTPPTPPPRVGSPKFLVPLRNQAVRDGEPVWFSVQFNGTPIPAVTWFTNGTPVMVDEEFQIRTDVERGESTLFIREAFPEDEGEFTCRIENTLGTAITNSHLFIVNGRTDTPTVPESSVSEMLQKSSKTFDLQSDLSIDDKFSDSHISTLYADIKSNEMRAAHVDSMFIPIDKQRRLELSCGGKEPDSRRESHTSSLLAQIDSWSRVRSESAPPPLERFSETVAIDSSDEKAQTFEFRLLSERKKLKVSRFNAYRAALPKGVKMEAEVVETQQAGGDKTSRLDLCRAKYAEAIASQRKELHIQLQGSKPRFVAELKPMTVMDGATAQFVCQVNAEPMPDKITWYHDDKMVPTSSPDVETKYDKKNGEISLTIGEVFPQDAGNYECVAANVYGKASAKTYLTVDAYEYLPDSEESYTSQTESVTSRTSSRMRMSVGQGQGSITEELRLSKRENMENVELVEVKWQQKKYADSVVVDTSVELVRDLKGGEGVEPEGRRVQGMTHEVEMERVSRSRKAPCYAQTSVTSPVKESSPLSDLHPVELSAASPRVLPSDGEANIRAVRSRSESRVRPLVANHQVERTGELLEKMPLVTDAGFLLRQQSPTGNLVRPTVRRVGPTRVETGFISQEIANLGQLPKEPSPELSDKKEVVFEGCPRPDVDRLATWSFTQYLERTHGRNEGDDLLEIRRSPQEIQKSLERTVESNLLHPASSSNKKPTFVKPSSEFHSEGEEEDIFHDTAEPSLSSEPVSPSVIPVPAVKSRPYMRSLSQVHHAAPEVTGPGPHPFSPEGPPRLDQTTGSAFVRVSRTSPPYKRAVIQNIDTSSFISVVKEFHSDGTSSPKQGLLATTPSDLDRARVNDKPANWSLQQFCLAALGGIHPLPESLMRDMPQADRGQLGVQSPTRASPPTKRSPPYSLVRPVVERLSPQSINPLVTDGSSLDSATRAMPQDVAQTPLVRPDRRRTASKVQEQNLGGPIAQFDVAQPTSTSHREDQFVSPVIANRAELAGHVTEPRPITRAIVAVGRASVDSANAMGPLRTDDLSMTLTGGSQSPPPLVAHGSLPRPVTRALEGQALQEEQKAAEGGASLNVDALALTAQPSTETRDVPIGTALADRPLSRVGGMMDRRIQGEEVSLVKDVVDGSQRMTIPASGVVEEKLATTRPGEKIATRAVTMETRLSPERLTDLASNRVDELSMNLSGSVESRDQYTAALTDRPANRVEQMIDEGLNKELVNVVTSEGLSPGEAIRISDSGVVEEAVLDRTTNVEKILTRAVTMDKRLSPERLADISSSRVDELSINISGSLESRDEYTAALTDRPVNRVDQILDEGLNKDLANVMSSEGLGPYVSISAPGVVEVGLDKAAEAEKILTRAVTMEKRLSPERLTDLANNRVDELSTNLNGSVESRDQYTAALTDRPANRVDQILSEGLNKEKANVLIGDSSGQGVCMPAPGLVEEVLNRSTYSEKILTRTVTLEKRISPDRLTDLASSRVDELSMNLSGSLESRDEYTAASTDRPVNRVDQILDEGLNKALANVVVGDGLGQGESICVSAPEVVEETFDRTTSTDKIPTRAVTMEKRISPDRLTDLASSRVDELSINISGSLESHDQYTAALTDRPVNRVDQTLDEGLNKDLANVVVGDGLGQSEGMSVSAPEVIEEVLDRTTSTDKILTRAVIVEKRLSPEKISEVGSSRLDDLALNISATETLPGDLMPPQAQEGSLSLSMVQMIVERTSPDRLLEQTSGSAEDLGVRLTIPDDFQDQSDYSGALAGARSPTRVQTLVGRISPESVRDGVQSGLEGPEGELMRPEVVPVEGGQGDLDRARVDDVTIHRRQEMEEEKEIITESTSEEFEVVDRKDVDQGRPSHSEITIEQEIITQSISEENERVPVTSEITIEQEIITQSISEENERIPVTSDESVVLVPPTKSTGPEDEVKQTEFTEERQIITETIYEEVDIVGGGKTQDEVDAGTFEEWETTEGSGFVEKKDLPAETETQDTSEETFEQWVVEKKTETEQRMVKQAEPEKETYDEGQETFEQWVVEKKTETEQQVVKQAEPEKESYDEGQETFEQWVVEKKVETEQRVEQKVEASVLEEKPEPEVETYDEGQETFEQWVVEEKFVTERRIEQKLEAPVLKKPEPEEKEVFEEWEGVNRIQTETRSEVEVPARHEVTEEKEVTTESTYEEWEVVEKIPTFTEVIVEETKRTKEGGESDSESFFSEGEVTEKITQYETIVEQETRRNQESSDDLGFVESSQRRRERTKSTDSGESFFSETEIIEKVTQYETTIETETKRQADDLRMIEDRKVKVMDKIEKIHESSVDLGIGAETKERSKPKSKDSDSESFFSETEVMEKYAATETTVETTTTQKIPWSTEVGLEGQSVHHVTRGDLDDSQQARLSLTRQTELTKETMFRELGSEGGIRSAKPAFVRPLAPAAANDGATITLSCQVAGWPRPEIKWFVDDIEIKLSADFRMSYDTEGVCTLMIMDVLVEDEGEYSVRASNQYGCCVTEAYLTVNDSYGGPGVGRSGPRGAVGQSSGDDEREGPVSSGEDLYSSGGEETRTRWTLEQRQQMRGADRRLSRGGGRGAAAMAKLSETGQTLDDEERRRLEEWEEGFSLRTGQIYDSSFRSTDVTDSTVDRLGDGRAPVFCRQLESRDVFESTPVKLECAVKGSPEPEIKWFQDGVQISDIDSHKKLSYSRDDGRCALYIDRVRLEDEAEYVCRASNRNGVATTWGELLVEKLIEGMEQLVMEEYQELEVEMEFKWKQPKKKSVEGSDDKTPGEVEEPSKEEPSS